MSDIYKTLLDDMGTLRNAEEADYSGMDDFLVPPKQAKSELPDKMKIASLGDLSDFFRVANSNTLVHKAEKDLWRISEKNGEVVVERLFNPDTKEPIRV